MRLNIKILGFLLFFSILGSRPFLAFAAPEPLTQNPVGKMIVVKGFVVIKNEATGKRLAETDHPIFLNDVVKTKKDSRVVIRFNDDTQIHVGPSTQLKITQFLFDEKKSAVSGFFDLLRGQIHVLTAKKDAARNLVFRTKNSTAGIRGTDFELAYWRRIRFSFVAVNQGIVAVENIKNEGPGSTIEKGQCGWVIHERKASPPKPMSEAPKWFHPIGAGEQEPPRFVEPWPVQAREEMPGYPH